MSNTVGNLSATLPNPARKSQFSLRHSVQTMELKGILSAEINQSLTMRWKR
jgi:hypothetical protein